MRERYGSENNDFTSQIINCNVTITLFEEYLEFINA